MSQDTVSDRYFNSDASFPQVSAADELSEFFAARDRQERKNLPEDQDYLRWLESVDAAMRADAREQELVNAVDADGFPPLDDTDLAIIEAAKADILSRNPGMAWPKPITRRCVKVGAA